MALERDVKRCCWRERHVPKGGRGKKRQSNSMEQGGRGKYFLQALLIDDGNKMKCK